MGHNGDWRIPYLPHPGFCGSDRRRLLCTGGAVCIVMMLAGQNVWVALLCAALAGMAAGFCTGILHTFMGIPAILSGILTQLGLYSINLKIMGKANQAINVDKYDLLVSLRLSAMYPV